MFSLETIVGPQLEKVETMLMQNLGGQKKSIMVFAKVAYKIAAMHTLTAETCTLRT